jgi:hypothetical protein
MAFVPVQVLLVTLVLNGFLTKREKEEKLRKLNIVINAFFTEVGTNLIKELSQFSSNFPQLESVITISNESTDEDFKKMIENVGYFNFKMGKTEYEFERLNNYVIGIRSYVLGMFQNPNLLEHDSFTDMLWAVFHVIDELDNRDSLNKLDDIDSEHLLVDIRRALQFLVIEWLYYMKHLKNEYPYLYLLAVKKNPIICK